MDPKPETRSIDVTARTREERAAHPAPHGALPVSEAVVVSALPSRIGQVRVPCQRDERGEVFEPMC